MNASHITVQDLAKEFDRISSMPNSIFITACDGSLLMNCDHRSDPKYAHLAKLTTDLAHMVYNLLTFDEGGCNWSNVTALRELGYTVEAESEDEYGWVYAYITKDNHRFGYSCA